MLELGFSPHARNSFGETPLHAAAGAGNAETVRLLLHHGSEIDARDANFDGTPLGYATVGSGEQGGEGGDWVATIGLLLAAGASREGAWVANKPPSEDVAEAPHTYEIPPRTRLILDLLGRHPVAEHRLAAGRNWTGWVKFLAVGSISLAMGFVVDVEKGSGPCGAWWGRVAG